MTAGTKLCAKCGAKISSDAPRGVCPACLLETGLGLLANEIDEARNTSRAPRLAGPGAPKMKSRTARMLGDFGDYELLEEIGRGGQGVVYRARQKSLNRTVALKVIGLGYWATEAHLKRFRREAESAASLEHPCIVPIHEVGERDGSCYFSMKFIEGGQLDEEVRREPMPVRRAVELIVKVARTVHYAHEHHILHRDIKPGNILLDRQGEPHLTDFGLARLVETESTVTRTMEVLGTPSYMAPEQAVGNNAAISSVTDVYGLGAVLYQLLTGQPPFAGGTTYETIKLLLDIEPRQPRLLNPKIDRDLSTICLKCLEKDSQRRYPSALALTEDLEHWLKHEPIRARRTGIFTRGRKWVRRNPTSAVLVVALSVAIGAMIWKTEFVQRPPTTGIAVLPFENLGDDKENALFADGMQDELLSNLAKIADLKVISRTSVMQYKSGVRRSLKEIAQQLGVSHVVEGNVRRAGNQVRVSVQLIDARNDTHLWAEHYERDVADVFAIQTEIAQQIANQVQAKLSAAEKAAMAERPTADPVAYALYIQAKAIADEWDWEGADKSLNRKVELLEKATQRDPNFALAYCELAKTKGDLYMGMISDPTKDLELAKKAAEAAVRVRPDLGETHLALARYYFNASFSATGAPINTANFDRAREELTIARRNLPNNSEALFIAARIDRHQNLDSALANFQKANDLDPRNTEFAFWLGETYFEMRRYYEWEQLIKKCAASGTFKGPWIQNWVAKIKLAQGDPVAAQSLLEQVPLDFSPIALIWQTRLKAALYLRDYDAVNRVIAATPAKFADDTFLGQPPESWEDGQIALARGDKQKALAVFAAARNKWDATWGDKPKDADYFARVAILDAGLGRKEDAIREAIRAVDLMPIAKSSLFHPRAVTNLALVYAWTGERDRALEQLEIVATIPAGPTYGDLRFNPCWDSLRGNKRFDKIVAAAKAASR